MHVGESAAKSHFAARLGDAAAGAAAVSLWETGGAARAASARTGH